MSSTVDLHIDAQKEYWALRELPAFPAVTSHLLQLVSNPNAAVGQLVELLRSDPSLCAEILRRANSAAYGLRAKVSSLHQGIMMLGFGQIRQLALVVSMGGYLHRALEIPTLRQCWRHTLAVAHLAESAARHTSHGADQAYTAGMLHDIGLLGLMVHYPGEYANLLAVTREHNFDLMTSERDLFDLDHCEAGAWLAEHWDFPPVIVDVAAAHHRPPAPGDASLTALVHWASRMSGALGFPLLGQAPPDAWQSLRAELPPALRDAFPEDGAPLAESIRSKVTALE